MNPSQKYYEFISFNPKFNPTFKEDSKVKYFKCLNRILSRQNQFSMFNGNNMAKKFIHNPFKDPFLLKENKRIQLRLCNILDEPITPKINRIYMNVRERIKHNKKIYKVMAGRALSLENIKFQERVFNQKGLIDDNFKIKKNLKKLKKHKSSHFAPIDIVLPKISKDAEKLFQTEINNFKKEVEKVENNDKLDEHPHEDISHERKGNL